MCLVGAAAAATPTTFVLRRIAALYVWFVFDQFDVDGAQLNTLVMEVRTFFQFRKATKFLRINRDEAIN